MVKDDGNAAGCPDGFEGDNCAEQVNTKFIGTYDVEMYGQLSGSIGGLASITLDAGTEALPLKLPQLLSHRDQTMGQMRFEST